MSDNTARVTKFTSFLRAELPIGQGYRYFGSHAQAQARTADRNNNPSRVMGFGVVQGGEVLDVYPNEESAVFRATELNRPTTFASKRKKSKPVEEETVNEPLAEQEQPTDDHYPSDSGEDAQ